MDEKIVTNFIIQCKQIKQLLSKWRISRLIVSIINMYYNEYYKCSLEERRNY